jgi:photosystem II stability/assembly factor-like uncharacterized protein
MRTILGRSTTETLACVVFLFILIPTVSGADRHLGSSFIPTQNETIWETLDHDYIVDDVTPWDIAFLNETHGWVLSQNQTSFVHGIILNTVDGGNSWQLQYSNATQRFAKIAIIDNDTIWVSGSDGLFFTKDCGQTWNMTVVEGSSTAFYGIFFLNQTHGWTGDSDNLYKTTDGGQIWLPVSSWIPDDRAREIHFVTHLEGWVIGFYGLYHTDDGGDTWEEQFEFGGWSMSFVSDTEAWAVADSWLAHMTDGETWVEQPIPQLTPVSTASPYFTDVLFLDSENGWLAGSENEMIYTPNGGRDWYSQDFPRDTRVMAIDFFNVTHGWATGWGGYIYRTTKGNTLGSRLWAGLADPVFLTIVGAIAAVVLITSGICIRQRRRKSAYRLPDLASKSPTFK